MKRPAGKKTLHTILGQPSWRLATPQVQAFVTQVGGHVGPVRFKLGGRVVQPYSIAPWAEEAGVQRDRKSPNVLKVLRGDFFCMPFGGNATSYRGEQHPVHGEVANARWKLQSYQPRDIRLSLRTKARPGRVDKLIRLRPGEHAVYSRHVISEASGPMSFGHHAMLKFPDTPGSGIISTSRFVYGQVFPQPFEQPENGGYSILKPGAAFESIERVPTITGEMTDLSRYPARRGFEDLVMLVSAREVPFAWTAVTFPRERFVWFALKDPRVLAATILWMSNGGRHYPPWNGRHLSVMGLEEVTSYFHSGLAESVQENPLAQRGHSTFVQLDPKRPTVVNYIAAVAELPGTFDRVEAIEAAANGAGVRLVASSGVMFTVPLDVDFFNETA